ncbi:hypothetical protein M9458_049934, partial [Cirrhinus mrigala]
MITVNQRVTLIKTFQLGAAITNIFIQNDVNLLIKKAYLKELDIPIQADRTVPVVSLLVSTNDDNISRLEDVNPMTNYLSKSCDEAKTGEPDDKGCPSNPIQCDTDSRLAGLSGPETRSVYGVDGDPLALETKDRPLERNLCTSEVTESQTSDKHMDSQGYATFQSKEDHQTAAPEFLPKETHTTAESLSEDKTPISNPQEVFYDKTTITEENMIDAHQGPCHDTIHEEPETNLDNLGATTPFKTLPDESKDQFSPPELICEHSQSQVSQLSGLTETSLYRVINEMESKELPLIDYANSVEAVEVILENNDQKDDSEPLKSQQTELGVSSEEPKITNPEQDFFSGSTTANEQSDVDQKSIPVVDTSDYPTNTRHQSSFAWDTFMKGIKKPHPTPLRTEL